MKEENPGYRLRIEAMDHLCPKVISLDAMHLYFMEEGKSKWASRAREAADEILKLRIEREVMRLLLRVMSENSLAAHSVRAEVAAILAGVSERGAK